MKPLLAVLAAATFMAGSLWVAALRDTTAHSIALAQATESAPRTTARARRDVSSLPVAARLTERQADAFEALADALDVSARRAERLNALLDRRLAGISEQQRGLRAAAASLGCIRNRLERLVDLAAPAPRRLRGLATVLSGIEAAQEKSIRHLRSINTKLAALGAVAKVTGVRPPPPLPGPAPAPEPGRVPGGRGCP